MRSGVCLCPLPSWSWLEFASVPGVCLHMAWCPDGGSQRPRAREPGRPVFGPHQQLGRGSWPSLCPLPGGWPCTGAGDAALGTPEDQRHQALPRLLARAGGCGRQRLAPPLGVPVGNVRQAVSLMGAGPAGGTRALGSGAATSLARAPLSCVQPGAEFGPRLCGARATFSQPRRPEVRGPGGSYQGWGAAGHSALRRKGPRGVLGGQAPPLSYSSSCLLRPSRGPRQGNRGLSIRLPA